MREIRPSGLEGGGAEPVRSFLPRSQANLITDTTETSLEGMKEPGMDAYAQGRRSRVDPPEDRTGERVGTARRPSLVPQELAGLRVALVHDWLTGMRGGEKCLEVLCRAFPERDPCTR